MNEYFKSVILEATCASDLFEIEVIQNLWSGYGKIIRYGLKESKIRTVVVKHVRIPSNKNHPRGWNTDLSHLRKLKSYQVEMAWYKEWSAKCDDDCRIPYCFALESKDDELLMVLEDIDEAGFPIRKTSVKWNEIVACLKWLANFHATFLGEKPTSLWEVGTYWHLETRPDELSVLSDKPLKKASLAIDQKLSNCKYKTFVHGDAKLANFCFSENGLGIAVVDFQYVGGGCGMKDLAYFIGSCLYEEDCERLETQILDAYFNFLRIALHEKEKNVNIEAVELEWRSLYHIAWTDFHRFLKGWSPGHWKINSYSERIAREVIQQL